MKGNATEAIARKGGGALRLLLAMVLAAGLMPLFAPSALAEEGSVAKIGNVEYETLNEAINNVNVGETIEILRDVKDATGISVASGSNFTIDFCGHTYTLTGPGAGSPSTETNGFQLLQGSTIVFKDGTIRIAEGANNIKRIVQSYADVTFDGMHFYSENQVGGENYSLSFNAGKVVFKGDTDIISSSSEVTAFDVYYWKGYYEQGVSVTFDDSFAGEITGNIVYDSSDPEKGSLDINGNGTFGGISLGSSVQDIMPDIEITGGTFLSGADSIGDFVASGMEVNESGKVVIDYETAVAQVGTVGYATIAEAVGKASNGGTVVLLKNATESVTIPTDAEVTLDLNGCKITNTEGNHTITNNGKLIVIDTAGTGVVDNVVHQKAALLNEGEVTVYGGKFTRSEEEGTTAGSGGNSYYVVVNRGDMTFKGGEVTSTGSYSSLVQNLGKMTVNDGSFSNGGIALKNDEGSGYDPVLEINGGTVKAGDQAVQNWSKATIFGGTFEGSVATWSWTSGVGKGQTTIGGSARIEKDVIAAIYDDGAEAPSVTISGGTVLGNVWKGEGGDTVLTRVDPDAGSSSISVTGGTIAETEGNKSSIPHFLAEGTVAKVGSDGLKTVVRNDLGAGEYIVRYGDPGITPSDLAEGLEAEFNEETGQWVVSKPAPPVVTKPSYDVAVDQPANGTVELSAKTAKEGQKVIVTVKPDEGFELASLVVADEDGNALKLELSADGTYSFEMPAGDVTVHAAFECDGGELCPSHAFTDVDQSQWYHAAIDWAVEAKVLNGIGGTTLMVPDGEITRAQMAQVIWNVEGRPAATEGESFSDVSDADWFADAVAWSSQEGIFQGYDGAFDPDAELTREQAAAVLMRWVASNGDDVSGRADLSEFPDADGVSDWAVESVRWAVDAGVIEGVANPDGTTTLSAQGTATRAQIAALMMRLEEQRTA